MTEMFYFQDDSIHVHFLPKLIYPYMPFRWLFIAQLFERQVHFTLFFFLAHFFCKETKWN